MGARVGTLVGISVATLCLVALFFMAPPVHATTGINQKISFEGKIVSAAGVNIADGTYNMEFKIYTAAGSCNPTTGVGCTVGWTEDWLVSGGNGVTFTSGTYHVDLDSVAANNFSGIDFNTFPLYLSLQIGSTSSCTPAGNFQSNCGGDGEMKPYILLTSTPYALNAGAIDGLDSTAFGQLANNQTWTGTNTFQPTTNINGVTIKQTSVGSPTADIFNVQSANSSSIIQVTGPSANNAAVSINSLGANAITLNSGAALTFTGAANSTWDLGASHTLSIQTTNNGPITTGTGLLTLGGNLTFSGSTARTITGPGAGGLTLSDTTGAINITGGDDSTFDVGSGNLLSVQTTNNGPITTGSGLWTQGGNLTFSGSSARIITGPATGGLTLTVGSGPLSLTTTTSGALTLTSAAAATWSTSAGALTIQSASGSAFTASGQGSGQTNLGTMGTGDTLIGNTSSDIHLMGAQYATTLGGVLIGDGTVLSSPILLQFNNTNHQGAETASTCSTTVNSGAVYYSAATAASNTTTNELRGCINGSWEDIVTGDQLSIILLGVVGSSGNNPGDLSGIAGYTGSPCKVTWASSTSVTVAPCVAYSGDRKVVVSSATTITGLGTAGSVRYQHICLNGTNGAPTATASNTSETAGLPAFSATAPILCIATVKLSTAPAITNIYDTRFFTTSTKQFVASSVAAAPGWIMINNTGTADTVQTTTTGSTTTVRGVMGVGSPSGSTTAVNGIMIIFGPAFVKGTGTITNGQTAKTSTTAGYALSSAVSTTRYANLGLIVDVGSTGSCNAATNCQFSMMVELNPM